MAVGSEIHVSLAPEMIEMVQRAVDAGEFANPSEVVEDALRTWTSNRTPDYDIEHLRAAWNEALTDDSPGVSMDEVFDSLDRHYAALESSTR